MDLTAEQLQQFQERAQNLFFAFMYEDFEPDALVVSDFDGTLSEFVPDPRDAKSFEGVTQTIRAFLNGSDQRKFFLLTGRQTTFFAKFPEFVGLVRDFPNRFQIHGLYGSQVWSADSDHEIAEGLELYENILDKIFNLCDFDVYSHNWNKLITDADGPNGETPLIDEATWRELILEDKEVSFTLQLRNLLNELGLLEAYMKSKDNIPLNHLDSLKAWIASEIESDLEAIAKGISILFEQAGLPLKAKNGSLSIELVPDTDQVQLDKGANFTEIIRDLTEEGQVPVYFFGDDKGDSTAFLECARLSIDGSKATTVLVDSTPNAEGPEVDTIRDLTTVHVKGGSVSAVEIFARMLDAKVRTGQAQFAPLVPARAGYIADEGLSLARPIPGT